MKKVKIVYYDPAGGETMTLVGGNTNEELNKNIEQEIRRNGWNRNKVDIVAEKDTSNGKWYWR